MPIRNPFAKRPDPTQNGVYDENAPHGNRPTFEKADTMSSMSSLPLSISSKNSQEPPEYKLSGASRPLCRTRTVVTIH